MIQKAPHLDTDTPLLKDTKFFWYIIQNMNPHLDLLKQTVGFDSWSFRSCMSKLGCIITHVIHEGLCNCVNLGAGKKRDVKNLNISNDLIFYIQEPYRKEQIKLLVCSNIKNDLSKYSFCVSCFNVSFII